MTLLRKFRWSLLLLSAFGALGIIIGITPFGGFLLFYSDYLVCFLLFLSGVGQLIDAILEKNESPKNRLLFLNLSGIGMILVALSILIKTFRAR
jgi:hypothetical protein